MTDVASIISELEQQRSAIDRAIAALREIGGTTNQAVMPAAAKSTGKKRQMSAQGRRNIAEATRKRWALRREAEAAAAASPATKKSARKRRSRGAAKGVKAGAQKRAGAKKTAVKSAATASA